MVFGFWMGNHCNQRLVAADRSHGDGGWHLRHYTGWISGFQIMDCLGFLLEPPQGSHGGSNGVTPDEIRDLNHISRRRAGCWGSAPPFSTEKKLGGTFCRLSVWAGLVLPFRPGFGRLVGIYGADDNLEPVESPSRFSKQRYVSTEQAMVFEKIKLDAANTRGRNPVKIKVSSSIVKNNKGVAAREVEARKGVTKKEETLVRSSSEVKDDSEVVQKGEEVGSEGDSGEEESDFESGDSELEGDSRGEGINGEKEALGVLEEFPPHNAKEEPLINPTVLKLEKFAKGDNADTALVLEEGENEHKSEGNQRKDAIEKGNFKGVYSAFGPEEDGTEDGSGKKLAVPDCATSLGDEVKCGSNNQIEDHCVLNDLNVNSDPSEEYRIKQFGDRVGQSFHDHQVFDKLTERDSTSFVTRCKEKGCANQLIADRGGSDVSLQFAKGGKLSWADIARAKGSFNAGKTNKGKVQGKLVAQPRDAQIQAKQPAMWHHRSTKVHGAQCDPVVVHSLQNLVLSMAIWGSSPKATSAVGADEKIGESGTDIETDSEGNEAKIEIEAEANLSILGDQR
ncbi:hypothetical protein U1Q18_040614 [Sarracenia purpurea var. burkii]